MTFEKIAQEAVALTEKERAALAASLLDTLPPPGISVTDEEVDRREEKRLFNDKIQVTVVRHHSRHPGLGLKRPQTRNKLAAHH